MNRTATPVVKDLVLVGGGHAHVAVIKSFGMRPLPGVRVTLITKDVATPYSGMIPGHIAGHYTFDETHIDLRRLCQFASVALYHAPVSALDLAKRQVLCEGRPPVAFDILSINSGSTPQSQNVPGAREHALPIKPIHAFLRDLENILNRESNSCNEPLRIAIVGGGAGGVELTLATQQRLRSRLANRADAMQRTEFHLLTDTEDILPTHNACVRAKFNRILGEHGVHVHVKHRVIEVRPGRLICADGTAVTFDELLWTTNAAAPGWFRESGLKTDADGFLAVNDRLQSLSHPFVFGAGDAVAMANHPRPKSGVFAVRQGKPLGENLRRALTCQPLRRFKPQKQFLSLISTGDQYAVASRGPWAFEGAWVWRLKDWIDRRWMRKYQELPEMPTPAPSAIAVGVADAPALEKLTTASMRCGGCGAKVGSTVLTRVLRRLTPLQRGDVLVGLNSPDDATVTLIPAGQASVQTVDFFRAFIDDPYVFGRIAANHCLGDIFAMGATPQSALAIAVVPFALEPKVEEQLFQLLAGAVDMLNAHGTQLAGGHSAEGAELALGLVINGFAPLERLLRKGGLRAGDKLILTKPLGTGLLFAANMRGRAQGRWIDAALESMLQSNRDAAQCLVRHHATACTDVTGFGLFGHLLEMLQQSPETAGEVLLEKISILDGVRETIRARIFSSLQPQNLRARRKITNAAEAAKMELYPILFDPQTAGGLLAGVPSQEADACLAALRQLGYAGAEIIGAVQSPSEENAASVEVR
ncbi:MAG: selenide, water dikinase SelD [Verrucomicrobia bacterium]|nr:selenide, water dikinase SelD [Verrucomicrobiota bacterium]